MTTPPERQLRPSVVYAGTEIARLCEQDALSPDEALAHIRQGDAQLNAFDYRSAFSVAEEFGWSVFSAHPDTASAFRTTLERLLPLLRPLWLRMLPSGRAKVMEMVNADVEQTLEIAQLLGFDPETVAWWDRLAGVARALEDEERLRIGRDAEQQAYTRECQAVAGTGLQVRWVAIEDNGAGYDIVSWRPADPTQMSYREHYIEVKGSTLAGWVYITANEWRVATRRQDQWELQVWLIDEADPICLKVVDLERHMPHNQGDGRWVDVRIPTDLLVGTEQALLPEDTEPTE